MEMFTLNQWAVVALVFVAGWLVGLMSRSGSKKWRLRYEAERDAHLAARRDYEARLAERPVVATQVVRDADGRPVAVPSRI